MSKIILSSIIFILAIVAIESHLHKLPWHGQDNCLDTLRPGPNGVRFVRGRCPSGSTANLPNEVCYCLCGQGFLCVPASTATTTTTTSTTSSGTTNSPTSTTRGSVSSEATTSTTVSPMG